jgi:acylphosphatase
MARGHLIIKGRVQGVCYRAFTQDEAVRLGLTGWVRNLSDGTVEALFEGKREVIEEAINRCWQGPPLSRVTDIEVQWEDKEEGFRDFRIR